MLHRTNTTATNRRGLVLVGTLPPPSGGIAVHIMDVGRAMSAAGTPVRYGDVPPGSSRTPTAAGKLALSLGLARLRGDVVHVHTNGHNDGSWRLVRAVSRLAGERALVTLHSGFAPGYIDANASRCQLTAAACHTVVCVNPAIAQALVRAGVAEDRLIVAPAFSPSLLPIALSPAGLGAIRRRHPVLLAATLARGVEYGAAPLLAAFALLQRNIPSLGLVIYGPAARDAALDAQIKNAGVTNVYRLGDLHRGEALGVLRAADVFIRPTLTDGDAISVRESLAMGVRTVASDAAPRPIGTKVFRSGDAQALAGAITEVLAGPRPEAVTEDGLGAVFEVYEAMGLATPRVAPVPSTGTGTGAGTATAMATATVTESVEASVADLAEVV